MQSPGVSLNYMLQDRAGPTGFSKQERRFPVTAETCTTGMSFSAYLIPTSRRASLAASRGVSLADDLHSNFESCRVLTFYHHRLPGLLSCRGAFRRTHLGEPRRGKAPPRASASRTRSKSWPGCSASPRRNSSGKPGRLPPPPLPALPPPRPPPLPPSIWLRLPRLLTLDRDTLARRRARLLNEIRALVLEGGW